MSDYAMTNRLTDNYDVFNACVVTYKFVSLMATCLVYSKHSIAKYLASSKLAYSKHSTWFQLTQHWHPAEPASVGPNQRSFPGTSTTPVSSTLSQPYSFWDL